MGIDVYVRRNLPSVAEPLAEETRGGALAADETPESSRAEALHAPAGQPAPEAASAPRAGDRELLAEIAIRAEQEIVPAQDTAGEAAQSEVLDASAPPPRFRLFALRFGAALLLVDEMALPDARRETQQRLGDLVRAAGLLSGGALAPTRELEVQTFYWPQIEAKHVDQSAPRATEALLAWVTRCTEDGAGVLVVVDAPPAAIPGDAVAPLAALEGLPVRRARIDARFLVPDDGSAQRAAWVALQSLAVTS